VFESALLLPTNMAEVEHLMHDLWTEKRNRYVRKLSDIMLKPEAFIRNTQFCVYEDVAK
jgi:hypothetical protein